MKLAELFLTQEDRDKSEQAKLAQLKQAIESNQVPQVHNAGGYLNGWSWGDLVKLGLASKEQGSEYGTTHEEWWQYSKQAPGPITLITRGGEDRIMKPGDKTDPVEVDYS